MLHTFTLLYQLLLKKCKIFFKIRYTKIPCITDDTYRNIEVEGIRA